jgi:hypothetical protein
MLLTIHNRALLRGMLAGAVALGGVSACSRSDRADAGRDTTQTGAAVTPADTQASTASQTAGGDTAVAPARDTATVAPQVATPQPEPQPARPTAKPEDTAAKTGDQPVSGYQAMGHDTGQTTDTSVSPNSGDTTQTEVAGAAADTTTRETVNATDSTTVSAEEPVDSTHAAVDVATDTSTAPADTATAGYEPMARDTTTEAQTELAVEDQPDTVTVVGDSSSVDKPGPRAKEDTVSQKADSLAKYHEADRIRPPEDSTELLGNVTPERNDDVEAVGDANAGQEAVGAAPVQSTGNIATGAEAVALMNRAGQRCRVEDSRNAAWDLASSPSTLNPCGTGTMTLPKVQTGEEK